VSPIFSAPASTKDIDEEPIVNKLTTRARSTARKKRAASSDLDGSEPEDAPTKRPAAKRRALSNRAYVEIAFKSVKENKKAVVSLS
jgi:hypothetical protein